MNEQTDTQAGVMAPEVSIQPSCGNCRFALIIPKDFRRVECRWGPPTATMIPTMTKTAFGAQQDMQQTCSFPAVLKNWHCFRHERKLDG